MSPLVLGEILGLFVNILTADENYHIEDCENLQLSIQIHLSEKRKIYFNFLLHFWNIHQISNILKENMIVIANVFPTFQTVKILLRPLSKKHCFKTRFDNTPVKLSQIPVKYLWKCFYHIFSSFSGRLIRKTSSLVLGEVLGVFVNILTADDKYPLQDCENLQLPIQMQLSEKRKLFWEFFVTLLEPASIFKHFGRKGVRHG